jgi:hypothetical protein
MIAKYFKGQNKDMQKFSWNLFNFKFVSRFDPKTYKYKSWHTNHSARWIVTVFVQYIPRLQYIPRFTRLLDLSLMAWIVFKLSNFIQFLPKKLPLSWVLWPVVYLLKTLVETGSLKRVLRYLFMHFDFRFWLPEVNNCSGIGIRVDCEEHFPKKAVFPKNIRDP